MKPHSPAVSALTLVEMLLVIAAVGVLATLAIPLASEGPEAAKKKKLEQDVVVVNSAIDTYLASGGDPTALSEANFLTALKSRVYSGAAAEMMGPQGPFLDSTVVTNATDFGWSAIFTDSPRPRFYVAQSTDGVVFGTGQSAAVGGVNERPKDQRPDWLWSFADSQPPPAPTAGSVPLTAEAPVTFTQVVTTNLQPPVFSVLGGTFPLGSFPSMTALVLSNPNPAGSSRVFFSFATNESSVSGTPYASPIAIGPGKVTAVAVSLDPSRYSNSGAEEETYLARPVLTWSNTNTSGLTYAQAVSGARSVTVAADGTGPFAIRHTLDGSDPLASSPTNTNGNIFILSPGLWTSQTLTLSARAFVVTNAPRASYFVNSEVASTSITAISQPLGVPSISPPSQVVFGSLVVSFAASSGSPSGVRFHYTTDGSTPSTNASPQANFVVLSGLGVNEVRTVKAIAAAPSGLEPWFTPSPLASQDYRGLNFDYYNLEGVLVGGGTIANNAALDGSVVLVSADGQQPNVTFNNNSIVTGDIYAPGTPTVTGVSSNRIINLDGAVQPTNYTINIQKADFAGNVYRRITPVTMPVVELPTGLTQYTNTITAGALAPGQYRNVSPNNNSVITIGVAGATDPVRYVFDQFNTQNNFTLNVVGPVILTINPGPALTSELGNGVVIGNSAHPEWLQVNVYSGNFTVGNGSAMYGSVLNPNGTVTFRQNATFVGGVTAKFINVENNTTGVTFSLPPPSQ